MRGHREGGEGRKTKYRNKEHKDTLEIKMNEKQGKNWKWHVYGEPRKKLPNHGEKGGIDIIWTLNIPYPCRNNNDTFLAVVSLFFVLSFNSEFSFATCVLAIWFCRLHCDIDFDFTIYQCISQHYEGITPLSLNFALFLVFYLLEGKRWSSGQVSREKLMREQVDPIQLQKVMEQSFGDNYISKEKKSFRGKRVVL